MPSGIVFTDTSLRITADLHYVQMHGLGWYVINLITLVYHTRATSNYIKVLPIDVLAADNKMDTRNTHPLNT